MRRYRRALLALVFASPLLLVVRSHEASSNGVSGFSGNPATGGLTCNECHQGGMVPETTITGPTFVPPGSTNVYTLTISGGQARGGGLGVSASDGALGVTEEGTYLSDGEIVHDTPRNVNLDREVIWTFSWTAPTSSGTYTIYGAGNSVNLGQAANGDAASTDQLEVAVTSTQTPGETSGPASAPLLVAGRDALTGTLTLTFETACQATDNNIYYGPLDQVANHVWTGHVCGIGTSGSYAGFDPGPGSAFFLVVGNDGLDEGSYGRTSGGAERPDFTGNLCGQVQTLADRCD